MYNNLEHHYKNIDSYDVLQKFLLIFENVKRVNICRKYWLFFKVS